MSSKRIPYAAISIVLGLILLFVTGNVATKAGELANHRLGFSPGEWLIETSPHTQHQTPDLLGTTEIVLQPGPVDGMDNMIDQSFPDTPEGDRNVLMIGTRNPDDYPGGPYRILLRFDLSSIPPNAGIDSAILEATIQAYQGPNTFQFFRATSDWDEATTWNTQPSYASGILWGTFSSTQEGIWVTRTVDLTEIFQSWQEGSFPNFGFYIKGTHEEKWTRHWLRSSDHDEATDRPKLTINYHPQNKLSVSLEDNGKGRVYSEPAGIDCERENTHTCIEMFDPGTVITLHADPDPGSVFMGWGGACSGTGDCILTLDAEKSISAAFFTKNTEIVLRPGPSDGVDNMIDQSFPDTPGGDLKTLIIGTRNPDEYPGGPYRILLDFDLSSIPSNSGIYSAILEATIQAFQGPNTFQFYRATSGWDEATTWNTQPTYASDTLWGAMSSIEEGVWVTRTVDLTKIFQSWQEGSFPKHGFYIKGDHEEIWTRHWFRSSDHEDEFSRPKLTINYRPQNTLSVSLAGTGTGQVSSDPEGISCNSPGDVDCIEMFDPETVITLSAEPSLGSIFGGWEGDCNGTVACALSLEEDQNVTAVFLPGGPDLIIQPGPEDGLDTFVDEAFPEALHGDDGYLMIGRSIRDAEPGGPFRSLLKIELPTLPPGATIETAVLDLNIQDFESNNTFAIYRATSSWDEGTTWNTIPTYDSSKIWALISSNQGQVWVQKSIDLTALVRGWYDGTYPNYGLYIKGRSEDFRTRHFLASSDHPTVDYRPRLHISFSAQYGLSVSLAGGGGGAVTSHPEGIDCGTTSGGDCYEVLDFGETIILTAIPEPGSFFSGWEGACTGTGLCAVLMYDQRSVTARFEPEIVEWKVYIPLLLD